MATPRWRRPVVLALGLTVVLLALLALTERTTGYTVDEGSYAIQAQALDAGGWEVHWPLRSVDQDGSHFPYHSGEVTERAEYTYVAHPAWPWLLSLVRPIGGPDVGLRLISMAAVVASALVAYHVAGALGVPGAGPLAFLSVVATPVLANGLMIWAHATSTALAGLAVLAALRVLTHGVERRAWIVVLIGALGGGVLLRSEGLLFAGALCSTMLAVGLWGGVAHRATVVAGAIAGGAGALAAKLVERAWTSSILGEHVTANVQSRAGGSSSWLSGRWHGLVTSAFDGSLRNGAAGPLTAVALLLVLLAVIAVLRPGVGLRPEVALAGAAAVMFVRLLVGSDDISLGLFAAAPFLPLAAVGVAEVRSRCGDGHRAGAGTPGLLLVVGTSVLFATAVVASQYDDGGGLQWGGRFFSPLLVPGAALVAVALGHERLRGRAGRAAAVALLFVTAASAFVVTDQTRRANADSLRALDEQGNTVVVVDHEHLARLDWDRWPDRRWIAVHDDDDVAAVIGALGRAGVTRATALLVPVAEVEAAGGAVVGDPDEGATVFSFVPPVSETNVRSQVGADG